MYNPDYKFARLKLSRYRTKCLRMQRTISNMKVAISALCILWMITMLGTSIIYYEYLNKKETITDLEDTVISVVEDLKIAESKNTFIKYSGKFTITSYCSCEICCGEWATDRPMLDNRELVVTSSGSIAEQGVTVAVDPKVIPYGTKIYIEGIGVRIAQDTGKAIKGNRLDVYYDSHEEARHEGIYSRNVWIIDENS